MNFRGPDGAPAERPHNDNLSQRTNAMTQIPIRITTRIATLAIAACLVALAYLPLATSAVRIFPA
jgi:hypothetical protein